MIRVMIGTVAVLAGFAVVECSPDAGPGLTGARAHDEQGRRDQETAPTGPRTALPRTAVAQYIFGDF